MQHKCISGMNPKNLRKRDLNMAELSMPELPGSPIKRRPLHSIGICDCSGSMAGDKIGALNYAVQSAIPAMQTAADDHPNAKVLVRCVKFAHSAQWHIAQPTPIADFKWSDLTAQIGTDMGRAMGKALSMVADQLKTPPMTDCGLPPVLVLITDGTPTDDFNGGLKALLDQPWGRRAVRLAVAVGQDADHSVLQKFIGHPELKPLQANNAETFIRYMKWSS
jgi:uncharacterized protein YegL